MDHWNIVWGGHRVRIHSILSKAMQIRLLAPCLIVPGLLLAQGDHQWVLEQATLTYQASHPLHQSEGASHAAKGKAVCHAGWCDLLIAVPVKSFDSGDSNRDLHMIQVARGAQFPMVIVRTRLPEDASSATSHSRRLGDPVRGPDGPVQAGSFRAIDSRKRHADLRYDSGHAIRFQNRSTQTSLDSGQERDSGSG